VPRLLAAVACALALAPAAMASAPSGPVFDADGRLVGTPFAPKVEHPRLTREGALAIFLRDPKIADWLARYPRADRTTDSSFDAPRKSWTVKVWWKDAGEIALGRVDDATGKVLEAWTGPQVAWKMARGYEGAFGGNKINDAWLWGAFCAVFLLGLCDWRRPLSVRNLDLLVLVSFSASLWFFNHGDVFTSVPLVYPPLVYLLVRALWIGIRGRPPRGRPVWPAWVLLAATVFIVGFRITQNIQSSNVIDVGYSGVIGAERIAHGQQPYGNFPVEGTLKACGPADADGEIRERIQANGRCESANPQGDTYGPVAYEAYLPGYGLLGWTGKWDDLPAAHFTSILWDVLCLLGLALVGRRFGGATLAAALPFAWAAYPFTQYASSSNTNDAIMPALLIWGFWLVVSPPARGAVAALAGWTKFAALIVAPLWLTYPDRRPKRGFLVGFGLATLAAFSILLLDGHPLEAARVFWDRTLGWQIGRESPFSIWDWQQYHARGIPDLHLVQRALELLLVAAALVLPFWPRRKSPLQLAALTAALLIGFQLVLTYWIYLYIPWFFAFSAIAALAPRQPQAPVHPVESDDRELPQLVPAR
jgi:hypothetical protein